MFKRMTEFFLMMMGISSTDEETKQQCERDRWAKQKQIAAREGQRRQETAAADPKEAGDSDSSDSTADGSAPVSE